MNFKRILRLTFRSIGVAVLFLLVLELCVRTDDRLKWGVPFGAPYSHGILTVTDSLGRHNRPNAHFEKWRINSCGFRGPEISFEKGRGVTRVAVVGASETFGLYESPGMEFSAQIQTILDTICPGRYQVFNAASAGMTPPRITHYFETWIRRFDPDILVFYPSPSFYLDMKPPPSKMDDLPRQSETTGDTFRLKRKVSIVLKRFIPETIQTSIKRFLIERMVSKHSDSWVWDSPPPERLQLFRQHVSELIDRVQRCGTQVVLATHANRFSEHIENTDRHLLVGWRKFYPRATEHCLLAMDSAANGVIRELGESHGVPVVDIRALVPGSPEHFADFAHFTDEGARLVASALAAEVLEIAPAMASARQ